MMYPGMLMLMGIIYFKFENYHLLIHNYGIFNIFMDIRFRALKGLKDLDLDSDSVKAPKRKVCHPIILNSFKN
jgi:hypothetical protein